MLFEDRLPNYSKLEIEVRSKFTKQNFRQKGWDDEDITLDCEKSFHEAVRKWLEYKITDNEDFEQEILEIMSEDDFLLEGTDEFCKLGQIGINLSQKECKVAKEKQEELS